MCASSVEALRCFIAACCLLQTSDRLDLGAADDAVVLDEAGGRAAGRAGAAGVVQSALQPRDVVAQLVLLTCRDGATPLTTDSCVCVCVCVCVCMPRRVFLEVRIKALACPYLRPPRRRKRCFRGTGAPARPLR